MKITYFQLEQHLDRKLAPAYIISGDDLLLKDDCIQLIQKAAKKAAFNERIRLQADASLDSDQLYTTLNSMSMLAEKRLIELDYRDHTPNKAVAGILKEYGNKPADDTIIIIDIGKLDDKISRAAWFQALEKAGIVVTIWPIPREQLPQWIMQRAQKYQMPFTHEAASVLADFIEGNLSAAAQSIEKIFLLQPQKPVDIELVNAVITDESRFNVFAFIENLIAGDKTRAFHILNSLKQEGAEPALILWGITRELRLLSDLAEQRKHGITYDVLFQKNRIYAKRQTAVRTFLRKYTSEDCWKLLSHAIAVDQVIKGAAPGNSWDSLEMFCLRVM